jgi:hypothetical protein
LDSARIPSMKVREACTSLSPWGDDWILWKQAIRDTTGKSWEEIAPVIYGDMFNA